VEEGAVLELAGGARAEEGGVVLREEGPEVHDGGVAEEAGDVARGRRGEGGGGGGGGIAVAVGVCIGSREDAVALHEDGEGAPAGTREQPELDCVSPARSVHGADDTGAQVGDGELALAAGALLLLGGREELQDAREAEEVAAAGDGGRGGGV
jgi:hypothetical protein